MENNKILVLGLGQNNFLSFLYGALKRKDKRFFVTAPFLAALNDKIATESWIYNNEQIVTKPNLFSFLQAIFYCLLSKHFYQTIIFILFLEAKVVKTFHFVAKQIQGKAFFIANKDFAKFDTFHFHFMQYSYLRELFFVPKNKKIVCSFWGSDLLRTCDNFNFYFVKKALNKATIITCQSAELKEIVMSKFGRNLLDKIEVVMFPIEDKIYNLINKNYNITEKIDQFKIKSNYAKDKINVAIGHNGSIFNNHLKIILALQTLQNINRFHFIVNLNYAITESEKELYKKKLIEAFRGLNCTYVILEEFFVAEALALSRLSTDVFIHAPISDALSSTMLEMLYASSIVITGVWLPYKTFRNAKLNYLEFSVFSEISPILDAIAINFETQKQQASGNKNAIENYFFSDKIVNKWCEILQ